jgi:hypothetical protein
VSYYLCFALQQIGSAAASVPNAAISIQQDVSAVTDTLDRPCGSGHPCGTLAEVSKGMVKIGDAIVTTQLAERKATPHVIAAMDKFGDAADHLSGTADALVTTANDATATLDEGKRTIAALQPLETNLAATAAASTATIQTFNGRLSDSRIDALLTSFRDMADNGDGIVADGRKVADKATADYVTPKPLWKRLTGYAGDTFDVAAFLARHY